MGLLKFILYALIIYYCILFFSRFIFKFLLTRLANKFKKNMERNSHSNNFAEHRKGETVVQYKKDNKTKSDPGGEYVDFEDLNDTL